MKKQKKPKLFRPVPPLPLDDHIPRRGPEGGGWIDYKTVTVILTSGNMFSESHDDGTVWFIKPGTLNNVPCNVARRVMDLPNIDIISNEDAQEFIGIARDRSLEVNKDIIEYNHRIRAGETKFINGERITLHKKKPIQLQNNRPFDHYMNAKRAWLAKRAKKSSKKKNKEDSK